MNAVVPSGKPINFEVTFPGSVTLNVGMKIYDLSTSTPTLLSTTAMTLVFNGTYYATNTFTVSQAGKSFLIQKSVYTDGTLTTANPLYSAGSEIVGPVDGFDENFGRTA
jgi:hypothetical protein